MYTVFQPENCYVHKEVKDFDTCNIISTSLVYVVVPWFTGSPVFVGPSCQKIQAPSKPEKYNNNNNQFMPNSYCIGRFTTGQWYTLSEVFPKFYQPNDCPSEYNEFRFTISFDIPEACNLFLCVRHRVHNDEIWDNNQTLNYRVYLLQYKGINYPHQKLLLFFRISYFGKQRQLSVEMKPP